jgi:acyl carrier protein
MDVQGRVVEILAEQALLDPSEVRPERQLSELGIDSLALVETIFAIEEAFDVQVPFNANDPEASGFDAPTVQGVIEAVQRLVRERA